MRRFRFSLDKLHKLREQDEKEAELALARVNAALQEAEEELSSLARREHGARSERYAGSVADMLRSQHYLTRLGKERDDCLERLAKITLELEAKREAWIQARAETQALEKLRDRKKAEHRKDSLAAEEHASDEIANSRSSGQAGSRNR